MSVVRNRSFSRTMSAASLPFSIRKLWEARSIVRRAFFRSFCGTLIESDMWSRRFCHDCESRMFTLLPLPRSVVKLYMVCYCCLLCSSSTIWELYMLEPVATSSIGWKCCSRLLSNVKLFFAGTGIVFGVWGAGCDSLPIFMLVAGSTGALLVALLAEFGGWL